MLVLVKCRRHLADTTKAEFNVLNIFFLSFSLPSLFHASCTATDLSSHKKICHLSQENMMSALIYSLLCMGIKPKWRVSKILSSSFYLFFTLLLPDYEFTEADRKAMAERFPELKVLLMPNYCIHLNRSYSSDMWCQ